MHHCGCSQACALRAGGTPSTVVLVDTGIVSSRVLSISKRTTDALVDLTVRSSEGEDSTVTGTPGHPFYVPAAHDYVAMGKLTDGTVLKTASGGTVSVVGGTERHGAFTVHNFVVEGQHNYYVSDARVLVHNGCGSSGPPRSTLPRNPRTGEFLPDPLAEGPHTVLGTRSGRAGAYTQGATFDENGVFQGLTDVTDHGRFDHPNPHYHPADPAKGPASIIHGPHPFPWENE